MKILGIDYGQKYIGLSIADENIKIAHPYLVLENKVVSSATSCGDGSKKFILDELKKIIAKENINKIIVGRPIGLSGQATEQTKITDEFVEFLKSNLTIPVESFDERFTSKMTLAPTKLRKFTKIRKDEYHDVAAAIILQDYLDRICNL